MSILAKFSMGLAVAALVAPVLIKSAGHSWAGVRWHEASRAPTGLAPDPETEKQAVVQVYAAQTFGWRGVVAVHTWIVTKPAGAEAYTRWDVVGWGGGRVVRRNYGAPDGMWYGQKPRLLVDARGEAAGELIPRIEAAVESYPFPDRYRSWPGPNSNTFTAHVGRSVPQLGLDLPPTAIGKDYRDLAGILGRAPSGGGVQLSLFGLAGLILAPEEGVEINVLGLSLGLDLARPALRLPALGRVGLAP